MTTHFSAYLSRSKGMTALAILLRGPSLLFGLPNSSRKAGPMMGRSRTVFVSPNIFYKPFGGVDRVERLDRHVDGLDLNNSSPCYRWLPIHILRTMRLLIASLLLLNAAYAGPMSGSDLHELCKAPSTSQRYALGLRYTLSEISAAETAGSARRSYCRAYGMKVEQTHRIVCQWLKLNPQHKHDKASSLIDAALGEIWPCARQQ
ncbi:Rap1a/Tai family immunity protein [Methylobacterium oxalidis]|uniref:Rap1a/Tai family immunity protein n=1 Tax=Methylobacterium oxalidis TaxID=944322 RepID=UPI0033159C71